VSRAPATSLTDTVFLRSRARRFASLAIAVVALTWAVWHLINPGGLAASSCFAGAALAFATLWLVSRRSLSRQALRVAEVGSFWLACAWLAALLGFAEGPAVASAIVIGLTHLAVLRSIVIPSSGLATGVITGLVGLPLLAAAAFGWRFGDRDLVGFVVGPSAWWVLTTTLATAIGMLTYGLRRDVHLARKLGQYVLERKIGEGGMGVVYRARHALLKRPTALKLLSPRVSEQHSVERFDREVQLASQLNHPNTVTIYDYGVADDGTFYYVMELLDGLSLHEVVELDGPQPPARVVAILAQVAGSLAEAHAKRLVHRDIKPSNILLCRHGGIDDVVKVVDFGLVKKVAAGESEITGVNTLLGSPLYMPPESVTAPRTYDGRGDLYSLGLVGYYLLTGAPPFAGDNAIDVLSAQIHQEPESLSTHANQRIPADLEALILELLAKNPADRPQTADLVRERLAACEIGDRWTASDAARWWTGRKPDADRGDAIDAVVRLSSLMPANEVRAAAQA
jgi:serine/threonine-protein kinase